MSLASLHVCNHLAFQTLLIPASRHPKKFVDLIVCLQSVPYQVSQVLSHVIQPALLLCMVFLGYVLTLIFMYMYSVFLVKEDIYSGYGLVL